MLLDIYIIFWVAVFIVGVPLAVIAWRSSRPRSGDVKLVFLGVAGGEAEAHIWTKALSDSGVWSHIRSVGDMTTGDFTTVDGTVRFAHRYEVWVRPGDEARAREVLGL